MISSWGWNFALRKQRWLLLQQVDHLKINRNDLGRKGRERINGTPPENAQLRVLWAWIRPDQSLYIQANKKQRKHSTYRITTYFCRILQDGWLRGVAFGTTCWSNLEYIWGVGYHTAVELYAPPHPTGWRPLVQYSDNDFKRFNF